MRRNDWRAMFILSVLLAMLALDLANALLPVIIPNATTGERMAIREVLQDHAGQLMVLLIAIVSAAIAMRQTGGPGVFDDKDEPK